jgi:ATP-dependent Lon protease
MERKRHHRERSARFKTALQTIIQQYTQEAGCDSSNARFGRFVAKSRARLPKVTRANQSSLKNVHEFLGAPKIIPEEALKKDQVGVATGLAWTRSAATCSSSKRCE